MEKSKTIQVPEGTRLKSFLMGVQKSLQPGESLTVSADLANPAERIESTLKVLGFVGVLRSPDGKAVSAKKVGYAGAAFEALPGAKSGEKEELKDSAELGKQINEALKIIKPTDKVRPPGTCANCTCGRDKYAFRKQKGIGRS